MVVIEDADTARKELKAKGVEFMNEPRDVNGRDWAANFRDPDGHLLELATSGLWANYQAGN